MHPTHLGGLQIEPELSTQRVKILLVDDHKPVRESLRQLIELAEGYEVIGEGINGRDAVRKVEELRPDVVLMDVNMPGMNGVDATREIKIRHPEVKVLALSALGDLSHVSSMIKAGANGYVMKGGTSHELLASIRAVKRGEAPLDHGVTVDVIRSLGELEDQLRHAQKMESLGQLVSGVAHDFNNLISIIQNYAHLVAADLDPDDPRRADLNEIQGASGRAAALVRQLLTFSRKDEVQPEIVDVNSAIQHLEGLWARALGEDIGVELLLEPDVWDVRIDPSRLDQIIMNLVLNARDAMPGGGTLSIHTENVSADQQLSQKQAGLAAKNYVCLTVRDDGEGMPPEVADRMFEPFFTTKPRDRGTGLGLATVHGIVKQALGSIHVDTAPGAGTTLNIYLPATETSAEPAAQPDQETRFGRGELVMVVEDEEAVRRLIDRILARGGYEVVSAGDATEALALLDRIDRPLDALVTDVVLPGAPSRVLVRRVLERDPQAKLLYVSGHSDQILSRHGIGPDSSYLQKPFSKDELLGALAAALSGS